MTSIKNRKTQITQVNTVIRKIRRAERRVLVGWIRFAHRHQNSHMLPIALFALLYIDGFTSIIPSTVCLIVSITISPQRWLWFVSIFATATTLNNTSTYILGRIFSKKALYEVVDWIQMEVFWAKAEAAIQQYGAFATFWGAIIGLPTQMITAIIGIADAKLLRDDPSVSTIFAKAILFAFLGHTVKALVIALLTRAGWLKLQKKFGSEAGTQPSTSIYRH